MMILSGGDKEASAESESSVTRARDGEHVHAQLANRCLQLMKRCF